MDTPSASQSEAPHQQWVGHCGPPPQYHQNPIPTYQYLTLTPSYPPLSNGTDNNTTWPGGHGAPHSAVVCPGKPASPCSPNGSLSPQLMPPQPSRISHQLVCPRLPLSDQRLLNGPQSPLQKESSCSAAMLFANVDLSQPHPAESFPGHTYKDSSLMCPIQQQPQCTVSPSGDLTRLVPHAAGPDKSLQSSTPESRYGLDPRALPSAVKVMAEDQAQWEGKVYASEPISSFPPLATTAFTVEDKGSASPFAIRATSYCFPRDGQTSLQSHLPLGALVSPLAGVNHGQSALPECAESESVGGCGSCGASMCPAMGWQDCGQRFSCPFCGKLSDVPWQFYQPTQGVEGIRVDKEKRPELSLGSYEVINHQRGEAAVLLLAIDVSVHALRGGHLEFVTHQIRSLLTSLSGVDEDDLTDLRVGLITYDGRIHLYDLSPTLSRPHMLVITDADELQLPVAGGLLVPLKDCIDSVSSVLHLIPQFAPEHDDPGGVPIELPVKGALAILQTLNCPGKLLIFHAAPLIEAGPAQPSGFFNSNKPKSIFEPSEVAASLVRDCVGQGCSVHLFHVSQELVGGAWPGHIPYLTGGALHNYSHLQGEIEKERFSADLEKAISMKAGFKAVLKIYVSKVNPLGATGAERHQRICREGCSEAVKAFPCFSTFDQTHGDVGPSQPIIRLGASRVNFFRYNNSSAGPTVVAMASVDWWTTVAVEVEHVRNLDEANSVAIQSALAYSTWTGERRTRIHTTVLKCSQHLQDAFRHFQAQELLSFYTKKMYCAVLERPLQELREELQTQITEALACYRKHCCSASVSAEQLVLPQSLRALPVYVNSLRKSEVLLPGLRSSVHQRLQQRCQVLCMSPSSTVLHFYPQLLPLSLPLSSSNPPKLEEVVRCSSASLNTDGLYLVNAPLTLLLWVGRQVPTRALMELFNTSCFSALPSGETKLPVFETPLSIYVRAIINSMNSQFSSERKLWVVKQGDSCEETLQRHLVEDKSPNGGASYADFLYHLHVNSVRFLQ